MNEPPRPRVSGGWRVGDRFQLNPSFGRRPDLATAPHRGQTAEGQRVKLVLNVSHPVGIGPSENRPDRFRPTVLEPEKEGTVVAATNRLRPPKGRRWLERQLLLQIPFLENLVVRDRFRKQFEPAAFVAPPRLSRLLRRAD